MATLFINPFTLQQPPGQLAVFESTHDLKA
jgi:hypothetical protein